MLPVDTLPAENRVDDTVMPGTSRLQLERSLDEVMLETWLRESGWDSNTSNVPCDPVQRERRQWQELEAHLWSLAGVHLGVPLADDGVCMDY